MKLRELHKKHLDEIYEMSFAEKIVAIGEIGLDYYYDNYSKRQAKRDF